MQVVEEILPGLIGTVHFFCPHRFFRHRLDIVSVFQDRYLFHRQIFLNLAFVGYM